MSHQHGTQDKSDCRHCSHKASKVPADHQNDASLPPDTSTSAHSSRRSGLSSPAPPSPKQIRSSSQQQKPGLDGTNQVVASSKKSRLLNLINQGRLRSCFSFALCVALVSILLFIIMIILPRIKYIFGEERNSTDPNLENELIRLKREMDKQNQTLYKYLNSSIDHRVSPCDDFYLHTCGHFHKLLVNAGVDSFWQIVTEYNDRLLRRGLASQNALKYSSSKAVRYLVAFYEDCLANHSMARCEDSIFNRMKEEFIPQLNRVYLDQLIADLGEEIVVQTRNKALEVVRNVRATMKAIIKQSDWLDERSRRIAGTKLNTMRQLVGFDDWIRNDGKLDEQLSMETAPAIVKGNLEENENRWRIHNNNEVLNNFEFRWIDIINKVGALNHPMFNAIYIYMGFLQRPFFELDDPPAIHYGWLGSIAAHEVVHGFDFQPANRKDWTSEAKMQFEKRCKCLVDQYGDITDPVSRQKVDGLRTLNENIADNSGVKVAFRAFQKHLQKHDSRSSMPAKEYVHYTPEQLFFYSWAMNWCEVFNRTELHKRVATDSHALYRFRVNVVMQNSKDFAAAFKCPANAPMNPAVEKKCQVW